MQHIGIYVASKYLPYAQLVANFISNLKDLSSNEPLNFKITSHWHSKQVDSFGNGKEKPEEIKRIIAMEDLKDVRDSNIVILCGTYPQEINPGGIFVEAGYIMGQGKKLIVLGPIPNTLLYHHSVVHVLDLEYLDKILRIIHYRVKRHPDYPDSLISGIGRDWDKKRIQEEWASLNLSNL